MRPDHPVRVKEAEPWPWRRVFDILHVQENLAATRVIQDEIHTFGDSRYVRLPLEPDRARVQVALKKPLAVCRYAYVVLPVACVAVLLSYPRARPYRRI